jgi:anaerobic ribonucleoside-triphosphate reductase
MADLSFSPVTIDPLIVVDSYLDKCDWRVKENSTSNYSVGGLILHEAGAISSNYWLNKVYSTEVANAHRNCDFHLHDLQLLAAYCAGWSISTFLEEGINGVNGKVHSGPAKHLGTAVQQLVNILGILQNEWNGAQALNGFDTYLAPFVKKDNMTDAEIKQCLQYFLFSINTPSRWGCFDLNTKIEKKNMWTSCNELKEGDLIWTFNRNTRLTELKPINKIIKKIGSKFIKIMSDNYDQYVTEDHNVLMNDLSFKRAKDIQIKDILVHDVIVKNIEKITTEEQIVWCVNTDNNTVYAKRDDKEFLTGNSQAPFSNVTLDIFVPDDLKDKSPILGGRKQQFTYGDCQTEMNRFNKIFFEIYEQGDYLGNIFQYPIPTLNCTKRFFEEIDPKVEELIYKLTGKFGVFYFSNFVNTDMNPEDVRSMCVHPESLIDVELEEDIIEDDNGNFYSLSEAKQSDIMTYYKKGEYTRVPIKSNFNYKVLTSNGYEKPKAKEEQRYAGPMMSIYLEDSKYAYSCIPEHECLIKIDNFLKEQKAKNLKIGDIFIDINNNEKKISKIEKHDFDGKVYSFVMPSRNYYVNNILTKNCCRLRLDLTALTRKNGSLFSSGDNTGSVGVVTINLPKIGYLSHSEEELFNRIEALMIIAKNSLEQKRLKLNEWFDRGLYPYTKRYLKAKYENHFSTIGLVGMNELCRNYFRNIKKKDWNLSTKEGQTLTLKILNFMRKKCSDFQIETGNLYNLESTPAESTSYRLAMHDKKKYPDILTAGTIRNPYYTNSSNLPVDFSDNPWDAIEIQNKIQKLYTGGCVTLDTEIDIEFYGKINMEDFFKKINFSIVDMEIEKGYDISNKSIKILAYDLEKKINVRKKILKIVYKGMQNIWEVKDTKNNILLKGSGNHRIFDITKNDFIFLKDANRGLALKNDGSYVEYYCNYSGKTDHIVDMQIEGKNYFSNNFLSHNTVFHCYLSEGIDDYWKIKDFLKNMMYNTEIPYYTITPTFSHCDIHGFIKGNVGGICPKCKAEAVESYQKTLTELEEKKRKILEELQEDCCEGNQ